MKAEESKRYILVSIFITLGIAILVVGILTLGSQQKRFVKSIELTAIFDDVSGLEPGNNVWFSGVKIGTVKKIDLTGNKQVRVTMNIEEKSHEFIRKNAKARIGSESFIGNRILEIYNGTAQFPAVEDNDQLEVEKTADANSIMNTLKKNNENLLSITSDFKIISNQIVKGKGTAGALLSDSIVADKFKEIVTNLHQVSVTTAQASTALAQFSKKLNRRDGLTNQLLTDTMVFNRIKISATQLNQITTSAATFTDNLKAASEKLNQNTNALGVLLNDPEFAAQLKSTMENLEKGSETLNEDLKAVQSNFLFRSYFKKQENLNANQRNDTK